MNAAPIGALCANHPGVAAGITCQRCGTFVCMACAADGTSALCPACRQLTEASAFPWDAAADFSALFGYALNIWQRQLAPLALASVLFFIIFGGATLAGEVVGGVSRFALSLVEGQAGLALGFLLGQLLSMGITLLGQGVALVGFYRVVLDALEGRPADVGRMFSQLALFPQYVVQQVLLFAVTALPMVGTAGVLGFIAWRRLDLDGATWQSVDWSRLFSADLLAALVVVTVAFVAWGLILLPVTLFGVAELVQGRCSGVEALRRAWALGRGQRLRIFGYALVAGLLAMVGLLLCGVGVVVSFPLAVALHLSLFLALRRSASFPAPAAT